MKPKLVIALVCISASLFSMGCPGQSSTPQNKYYDDAKALADKVSAHQDHDALKELLKGAQGTDYWTRTYSIEYLGLLLLDKKVIDRNSIIDVLVSLLDDSEIIKQNSINPEQGVQQDIVDALTNAGSDAVAKGLGKIKAFVLTANDNSLSWDSVKALGLLVDPPAANEATSILIEVLQHKTQGEDMHDAPRLRDMALDSLAKIGEKQPALVRNGLEGVLPKLDAEYAKKALDLIAHLKNK